MDIAARAGETRNVVTEFCGKSKHLKGREVWRTALRRIYIKQVVIGGERVQKPARNMTLVLLHGIYLPGILG
jgi:hypothetical protein